MLLGLETVAMHTVFLQGPDETCDHGVLLPTVRDDELLLQPIAADQAEVMLAGKDQILVGINSSACSPCWFVRHMPNS